MRFDSCAAKFSEDPGSKMKGGELGYATPGSYVAEFNDIVFFSGVPGKLYKVKTQFGVHLIEIMDKKGAGKSGLKAAYIAEAMAPSEKTQNVIHDQALQLVSQNRTIDAMKKAITSNPQLTIQSSKPAKRNDYTMGSLPPSQDGREVIRWAFDKKTTVGAMSPEVYEYQEKDTYYTSRFILAGLENIVAAGIPSVADLKKSKEMENGVRMMKRAKLLCAKLKGVTDLNAVAAQYNVKVDTANGISFNQGFLPNAGNEPKVVAAASLLPVGKVAGPIEGYNGAYVIQLLNKQEADLNDIQGLMTANRQLRQSIMGAVKGNLMNAMRKSASIKDKRSDFF
jgi:peptidyl-prolyl cis-trans isomerase D